MKNSNFENCKQNFKVFHPQFSDYPIFPLHENKLIIEQSIDFYEKIE